MYNWTEVLSVPLRSLLSFAATGQSQEELFAIIINFMTSAAATGAISAAESTRTIVDPIDCFPETTPLLTTSYILRVFFFLYKAFSYLHLGKNLKIRHSSPGGNDKLSPMKAPHFLISSLPIPQTVAVLRSSSVTESGSAFLRILIKIKVVLILLDSGCPTVKDSAVATHTPTK